MIKHSAIIATLASFIAIRTVQATPMNRQAYNDLRGWQVPNNENPADEGYLVIDTGVSERNVEGFDGYVSWLPKTAFDEQYKPNKDRSITKEFLESEIVNVQYTHLTGTLTHCAITVKSGFTFTGESACVDETSFNKELGEKYAYEQAFEKMWLPYGFWLKQKLFKKAQNK